MNPWLSHALVAVLALGAGVALAAGLDTPSEAPPAEPEPPAPEEVAAPAEAPPAEPGVTGVGGIFFQSDDAAALRAWYADHLGVGSSDGIFAWQWREDEDPEEVGYTVWGIFPSTTGYFDPTTSRYMLNFRVHDLPGLLTRLREAGVEIAGELEEEPNGSFAWIVDPEGRKIELWEPVPSAEDPYLE